VQILKDMIGFLCFIVSPCGMKAKQETLSSIINWEKLQSLKELQSFLGLTNKLSHLIRNYADEVSVFLEICCFKTKIIAWTVEAKNLLTD
jgi:hypothetical protein